MIDPALELDHRLRAPLAQLHGVAPPAPQWFSAAIAQAPDRSLVPVEGAGIELLAWGERGRPGLFFLHGGRASADWFAPIAPVFAKDFRVAASSMSGAGRSGWRELYTIPQFAREMVACAHAAGLFEAEIAPIFVAHSFGSRPLFMAAADTGVDLRGAVVLDSAISSPETPDFDLPPSRPSRIYPTLEAALARFRLIPPQVCDNLFLLDYIARQSLRPVSTAVGEPGWTWRFDPFAVDKMSTGTDAATIRSQADDALRAARCPVAFIRGRGSAIVRADNLAYTRSISPRDTQFLEVADAAHHLFLDQPLAVVEALRGVFAGWAA